MKPAQKARAAFGHQACIPNRLSDTRLHGISVTVVHYGLSQRQPRSEGSRQARRYCLGDFCQNFLNSVEKLPELA